jgi:flagellar hook-length control protein FliK
MPPAPLTPNSTNTATPQGPRTGVGPSAGGGLGFDFAQVMARQMERLVPQERQTFAADVPEQPEAPAHTQDSRPIERRHSTDRTNHNDQSDPDTSDEDKDPRSASARQRSKGITTKPQRPEVDDLLEGLMQGAAVAPITPTAAPLAGTPVVVATPAAVTDVLASRQATSEQDAPARLTPSSTALQSVQLSAHTRLITNPQTAPSPESLVAFAKSMGLADAAIQNVLAQQPGGTATAVNPALGNGAPNVAAGDDMVALQLAAMNATAAQSTAQPMTAASGAGLAAAATTLVAPALPGLTPTDMAAIQQLQITVLPAAVLPVNTHSNPTSMPSTLDMLSLMGTGINEQDVEALLTRFSEESGQDSHADQQASQDEGQHFSSFAQSLARNAPTTNAAPATSATVPMSEVYDQLSDKMATEMAARMHKQLSDGEWKMKFALRPSNLGGVEIQLEMKDGKLDAVFHADNPLTRDLLQNSSQRLREALGNFGINAGQVNVGQGGGNAQQNNSGNSNRNTQVRDNSSSQVNGDGSAMSATTGRNKANASLLDLYA